nr:hypothetical protein [Sunxiuqinia sp.]
MEDVATIADLARNRTAIKKAFLQNFRKLSVLDQKLNQLLLSVQESENQINIQLESISSTLKDQKKERIARHQRQLKLKSKRVIMAFVFLFLLLSASLIGNIYHKNELARMSDSDIKYRYIQMMGGINAGELFKLAKGC